MDDGESEARATGAWQLIETLEDAFSFRLGNAGTGVFHLHTGTIIAFVEIDADQASGRGGMNRVSDQITQEDGRKLSITEGIDRIFTQQFEFEALLEGPGG